MPRLGGLGPDGRSHNIQSDEHNHGTIVRNLRRDDLGDVARVHANAFPSSWLTKFGTQAIRRYYTWQLEGPHEIYPIAVTMHETFAGFCFGGVFPTAISGFVRRNLAFLILRAALHPTLFVQALGSRREAVGRSLLAPARIPAATAKRPFDILSIAVDPAHQGRGIGKLLMHEAQSLARRNGFTVMTLMVDPKNVAAVAFYEAIGWQKSLRNGGWRGNMECWLQLR